MTRLTKKREQQLRDSAVCSVSLKHVCFTGAHMLEVLSELDAIRAALAKSIKEHGEVHDGRAIIWKELCSLREELDATREELTKYKSAMLADIRGAGPRTGPIYHSNIRKALDMPAEGSGPDIIQPCPYPAEEGCEDCQKETL